MTFRILTLITAVALAGCADTGTTDDTAADDTAADDTGDTGAGDDTGDTGAGDTIDDGACDTRVATSAAADLQGVTWVSEGEDVSDLLAAFNTAKITADFNADGSYTVVSEDTGGTEVTFTGTYSVTDGKPAGIELTQTSPSEATSTGIFSVAEGVLYYEVVATGTGTPPTTEGGFDSSEYTGKTECGNVQVFR